MGCGGSRFDKRRELAGDLYTIGTNFVGGEGYTEDGCPVDKVAFSYAAKEVEPKDFFKVNGFTAEDEEIVKKIAQQTWDSLTAQLGFLEKEHGGASDNKKVMIGHKYTLEAALKQLNAVRDSLKEKSGFTFEEKKADAMEGMMMEGNAMEGEMMGGEGEGEMMMEGGDEMMGMDGMAMMEEEDLYAGFADDISGWANFPKWLLWATTVHPYFGDLVKSDTIHFEFAAVASGALMKMPSLNPLALLKKGLEAGAFSGAASLLSVCVNYTEDTEKDVWFAGWAGDKDFESLKEISEAKGPIMFPGVLSGWDSAEAALRSLDKHEGKSDQPLHKVVFSAKTNVHSGVVCRHFVCRFRATIESHEEKEGVHTFALKAQEGEAGSVEEWIKKRDAPPAPETPKMEEGMMMEGEMMGGDMAMDPPMMES